ncbi:Uncharacterized protein Fot_14519 [Forsythia ovata]|uniref:Uncharacterized protein n=1 Tax=Forsythia ovata TaxID=205694 RepID=A0ABD1W6Z3_9LAMI
MYQIRWKTPQTHKQTTHHLTNGLVSTGIELGNDTTVLLGLNGDAIASSRVRSLKTNLHISNETLHRTEFFSNADTGNLDSELGISPASALPETLKSCKLGKLKPEIEPENLFPSNLKVSKCVKWFRLKGIIPKRLFYDRSNR